MAKLTLVGTVAVITTGIPKKHIETLLKFKPDKTKLLDEDKKPRFAVGFGAPSCSAFGITFNGESATGEATATFPMPNHIAPDERVGWAKDQFGYALLSLNELEAQMADAMAQCTTEFERMDGSITIL